MAMGDDTYGQCGTNDTKRPTFPPFQEHRVSYPIKVVRRVRISHTCVT